MNYPDNRLFISHAHEDKVIAGALKSCLEYLGFRAFVAHNDIIPSKQWREEIVKALDESRVFIVIVSSNSNKS
ncbi:MAG TPA: toll/interleukin-1 receptor domain-containing protein, partial [Methanomassiliicoccales archaeon]|nr:toll/interleukin-1 receptor domain-containing protein [Methanomassiliicoccales archaeon]